jgi:pimeloyl-ACP methyl ester carboxylesterase
LLALLLYGFLPWWLAGRVTAHRFDYPDRENAGLTPASFRLKAEEVAFTSADGVPLSGWWVPAESPRGSVILVHGLNRSRIEMARKLPFVHEQGWNALALDLRRHGRSGGELTTFGLLESRDVAAAAALARQRCPGPVVLWGVSLGAATVMLEAADDPEVGGVVCDSAYRSLPDTVRHHVDLLGRYVWPRAPIASAALFWIGRRAGFDPAQVDVLGAARKLSGRPVLFVASSGDRRMPPDVARDLQAAAGPGAQLLEVPGEGHGHAWRNGTAAYQAAVEKLLAAVAPPPDRG